MRRAAGMAAALLALAGGAAMAQQGPGVLNPPELVPRTTPEPQGGTGPALVVESPLAPSGQNAPQIMTIDPEEAFARTRWGQRVHAEVERRSAEIAAENDRLADQFAAEEQQLTMLRTTLSDEEFRKRADEFDKRVVEVRRARDAMARELEEGLERERAAFFRLALPVLAKLMQERGASVVLDQRAIFVSADAADVTEALVQRFDETVGQGPAAPETEKPEAGEPQGQESQAKEPGAGETGAEPAAPTP